MAFYLLKLRPPRATFFLDMTDDERTVMFAHAGYWKKKLGEGVAVAFGPVIEPDTSWGLGILEVADEAQAKAFAADDPVITSERGFRYEFFPMPALVARGGSA